MYRLLLCACVVLAILGCKADGVKTEPTPPAPSTTTPPTTPPATTPPVTPPAVMGPAGSAAFPVIRDARITCHPSEVTQNSGAANRMRTVGIQKQSAEVSIMDFDHAALKAFFDTHAGREITGQLTLGVYQVQGGGGKVEVASLDSAVDWVEGDKVQEEAAKGQCSCAAAQTGVKPWTTPDGKEVASLIDLLFDRRANKIKTVLNSAGVEVTDQKTVTIDLDQAFVKHLATDPNCRGLVLFNRTADAKIDFYSRDQRNNAPTLTLTAK